MKIIIGLGNPGEEYENTRHNAGFKTVDKLQELLSFPDFKKKRKFKALFSEGEFRDEKIVLIKPLTYMNLSGQSAQKVTKYFKVLYHDMWVIYDDLDFELGTIKIRENGNAGSHNGLSSIIKELGSNNFPRVRIGIDGRTDTQKQTMAGKDYVLGKFNKIQEKTFEEAINKAAEAIIYSFENGISNTMNKFNTK